MGCKANLRKELLFLKAMLSTNIGKQGAGMRNLEGKMHGRSISLIMSIWYSDTCNELALEMLTCNFGCTKPYSV